MTNSDQLQLQGAFALLAACMSQLIIRGTGGPARSAFLSQVLDAVETIEALVDPTRDGFVPTSFPPKASPDMRPDRLLLAQSLLVGHASRGQLRRAA